MVSATLARTASVSWIVSDGNRVADGETVAAAGVSDADTLASCAATAEATAKIARTLFIISMSEYKGQGGR
jgi:hypothetical protein